jgi:hypothetical protein
MNILVNRVMRAALLDKEFYKEVEVDTSLNQEALMVVIIVSIAGGIGSFFGKLFGGEIGVAIQALIISAVVGVANYYIWAYVTHFIGTNMFKGEAEPDELLRVLGYASGPRILSLLFFIPCLGGILNFGGSIWALVAGFFGVQEALDLDTTETLVTVVLGWVAIFIINAILTNLLGFGALGLGSALSVFGR